MDYYSPSFPPLASSPSAQSFGEKRTYPLIFTGTVGEYYKIWFANIALTIITLGFYAPWAKVRREQYFLGNTYLDGASFEYTADPWKILKGRAVLAGLIIVMGLIRGIRPEFSFVYLIGLIALIPWVITMGLRFRARYTRYRNLSFAFTGTVKKTFYNIVLIRILYITIVLIPLCRFMERAYITDNVAYGRSNFRFRGTVGAFYLAYVMTILALFAGMLFIIGSVAVLAPAAELLTNLKSAQGIKILAFGVFIPILLAPLILRAFLARATWDGAQLKNFTVRVPFSTAMYVWIAFSNLVLRTITLGLATPYCAIRSRRFLVSNVFLVGAEPLDSFIATREGEVESYGDQAADLYDFDLDLGF